MTHTPHPRRLMATLALLAAGLAHAEPARLEAAHRAYQQGEFGRSLALYEALAAQGDAEAAERAGFMLMQGTGLYGPQVRPDPVRATALLEQAGRAGRTHAVFVLGMTNSAD